MVNGIQKNLVFFAFLLLLVLASCSRVINDDIDEDYDAQVKANSVSCCSSAIDTGTAGISEVYSTVRDSNYNSVQVSYGNPESYTFTANAGTTYYIYWQDSDNSLSSYADGEFSVLEPDGDYVYCCYRDGGRTIRQTTVGNTAAKEYYYFKAEYSGSYTIRISARDGDSSGIVRLYIYSPSASELLVRSSALDSYYASVSVYSNSWSSYTFDVDSMSATYHIIWRDSQTDEESSYLGDAYFEIRNPQGGRMTYSSATELGNTADNDWYFTPPCTGTYKIYIAGQSSGYVEFFVYSN